jgi:hypothetical protein
MPSATRASMDFAGGLAALPGSAGGVARIIDHVDAEVIETMDGAARVTQHLVRRVVDWAVDAHGRQPAAHPNYSLCMVNE